MGSDVINEIYYDCILGNVLSCAKAEIVILYIYLRM
jgi:hypothetical protein